MMITPQDLLNVTPRQLQEHLLMFAERLRATKQITQREYEDAARYCVRGSYEETAENMPVETWARLRNAATDEDRKWSEAWDAMGDSLGTNDGRNITQLKHDERAAHVKVLRGLRDYHFENKTLSSGAYAWAEQHILTTEHRRDGETLEEAGKRAAEMLYQRAADMGLLQERAHDPNVPHDPDRKSFVSTVDSQERFYEQFATRDRLVARGDRPNYGHENDGKTPEERKFERNEAEMEQYAAKRRREDADDVHNRAVDLERSEAGRLGREPKHIPHPMAVGGHFESDAAYNAHVDTTSAPAEGT